MEEDPRSGPQGAGSSVPGGVTQHAVEERLNRLAQDLDPLDGGEAWFRSLSFESRQGTLRTLAAMILQAHPSGDVVERAVQQSGLKQTYTPVGLLRSGPLPDQLAKIANLPVDESIKSFRLLVGLLAEADRDRRNRDCAGGCAHWWHHLDGA